MHLLIPVEILIDFCTLTKGAFMNERDLSF